MAGSLGVTVGGCPGWDDSAEGISAEGILVEGSFEEFGRCWPGGSNPGAPVSSAAESLGH